MWSAIAVNFGLGPQLIIDSQRSWGIDRDRFRLSIDPWPQLYCKLQNCVCSLYLTCERTPSPTLFHFESIRLWEGNESKGILSKLHVI